jgi:hypothetical protein
MRGGGTGEGETQIETEIEAWVKRRRVASACQAWIRWTGIYCVSSRRPTLNLRVVDNASID